MANAETTRIDAQTLIPGRGDPIRAASVVLSGPSISYVGPTSQAPTANTVVEAVAVMPGMWDAHTHFFGITKPNIEETLRTRSEVRAARATRDAKLALEAGFTSVREVGGLGVLLDEVIAEGTIPGPKIYGAGSALSPTGGHADVHAYPLEWVHAAKGPALAVADGVPGVLKAVRSQLRMNARVIKICASGGVMSEVDHPIHQQFSDEELRTIVEEAARAERVVAAHCHGKPGIMAALRAGVKTIEHGTYLDEEAADLMLESDAILVPTRTIVELLLEREGQMPEYAWRKISALADRHWEALVLAISKGVTIAAGTDIFFSGPPWGENAREASYYVKAGMSTVAAIATLTANGPMTLGPQAPRGGVLEDGADADVITIAANPIDDVEVLADPSNITGVWKDGRRLK